MKMEVSFFVPLIFSSACCSLFLNLAGADSFRDCLWFWPDGGYRQRHHDPERDFDEAVSRGCPRSHSARDQHDDGECDTRITIGSSLNVQGSAQESDEEDKDAVDNDIALKVSCRHRSQHRTDACAHEPLRRDRKRCSEG